jgi:hypothetical protein
MRSSTGRCGPDRHAERPQWRPSTGWSRHARVRRPASTTTPTRSGSSGWCSGTARSRTRSAAHRWGLRRPLLWSAGRSGSRALVRIQRLEPLYGRPAPHEQVAGGRLHHLVRQHDADEGRRHEAQAQLDSWRLQRIRLPLDAAISDWLLGLPGAERPAARRRTDHRPLRCRGTGRRLALGRQLLGRSQPRHPDRTPTGGRALLACAAVHRRIAAVLVGTLRPQRPRSSWEHDGEMATLPPGTVEVVVGWHVPGSAHTSGRSRRWPNCRARSSSRPAASATPSTARRCRR